MIPLEPLERLLRIGILDVEIAAKSFQPAFSASFEQNGQHGSSTIPDRSYTTASEEYPPPSQEKGKTKVPYNKWLLRVSSGEGRMKKLPENKKCTLSGRMHEHECSMI